MPGVFPVVMNGAADLANVDPGFHHVIAELPHRGDKFGLIRIEVVAEVHGVGVLHLVTCFGRVVRCRAGMLPGPVQHRDDDNADRGHYCDDDRADHGDELNCCCVGQRQWVAFRLSPLRGSFEKCLLTGVDGIKVTVMNIKTWIATGALAVLVVGGSITGAAVHSASVQADAARTVQVRADAQAATDYATQNAAAATAAEAQKVAADASYAQYLADQKTAADLAAQQAQAASDAAAAAAAAQVAAAPVQRASIAAPTGPIKCPAGSTANSGDAGNDTSCFPDICFHIVLPDPAHPECVTAFKP